MRCIAPICWLLCARTHVVCETPAINYGALRSTAHDIVIHGVLVACVDDAMVENEQAMALAMGRRVLFVLDFSFARLECGT